MGSLQSVKVDPTTQTYWLAHIDGHSVSCLNRHYHYVGGNVKTQNDGIDTVAAPRSGQGVPRNTMTWKK